MNNVVLTNMNNVVLTNMNNVEMNNIVLTNMNNIVLAGMKNFVLHNMNDVLANMNRFYYIPGVLCQRPEANSRLLAAQKETLIEFHSWLSHILGNGIR